jgi:GTP pyrophosphokinase
MLDRDQTLKSLVSHDKSIDKALIAKAMDFAIKYHGNDLRDSGEPYYTHPIAVAQIVAEMQLDTATIATALLHDTIEDTDLTLEEISAQFSPEIASLVDGVTKLKKVKLTKEQVSQAENFRKLLLAMIEDIRVLLVKLADRLHNMRTISFKSDAKRAKIALETLEIYAPLAERIGVNKIKNELEDISFKNLYPDVYDMVINKLNEISANRQILIQNIIDELSDILTKQGINSKIQGRAKSPYSIWLKMVNKNTSFEDLSDIIGFRILVDSQQDCYQSLGAIHSAYKIIPGTFHDFISVPKHNGYQSLHTVVVGPMNRSIEVQIRTHKMHELAELGLAAHWSYKQQYNAADVKNYKWIRELISILEHSSSSEEVLQHTKLAMYYSQIFCFTPKGSIISLPKKATTIDFAYAVHSDIGHHCIGAKINGKLVPLRAVLKTGDMVEIITSKNQFPSPHWEDIVITGKAKSEIKKFLKHKETETNIQLGKNLLENAFIFEKIQGVEKILPSIAEKLDKTIEGIYLSLASGELSTTDIINLSNLKPEEPKSIFQLIRKKSAKVEEPKSPISGLVMGVSVNFAKCCNPIPGDKIVGILYTGKGVTIHMSECNVCAQSAVEKIFNLNWNNAENQKQYMSKIKLICQTDSSAILKITQYMQQQNIGLVNLQVKKIDQFFNDIVCDVEVPNLHTLNLLISSLQSEKLIYSVARARL